MSDFKARIEAELDTSKVEQQINQLGKNQKVKLDVDTGTSQKNIKGLNDSINTVKKNTTSLGSSIKSALGFGSAAAVAAKSVRLITNAGKEALQTVEEIDSAMTQLQIVSGATGSTLNSYLNESISLAKELGQSVTDVVDSITTFSRLGYSFSDSSELAKYSAMLSNIADVTSDAATTGLTSIMKGYSFDTSDAEHVADVLTEIGQSYAVSASELITAYEKSGAALNAGGTSFEKSAALIAAANAAVQDASTVGTALKTISARIRGATTELDEMGESTEGLAEGFSKYAEEIQALTGFSILEEGTTDDYKDIYDIFEGIAGCWDDLSETSQARVAEILGGTRQLTVVSSIMSNWSDAAGAYEDAINSAGVATAANEVYMQSLEAKISQLKASFQELSTDTFSSDMLGGIVDTATSIVDLIDKTNLLKGTLAGFATAGIVKGFTLIASGVVKATTQMSNFGSALTMVKSATTLSAADFDKLCAMTQNLSDAQLKAVLSSTSLSTQQRVAILTSRGMSEAEAEAALAAMGLSTSEGVATASTISLSSAFKGLVATLMTNPFILIIAGVTAAVSAYSTYKQKQEEVRQASLEAGSAAVEEADSLRELYTAYQEVNAAYQSNTGTKEELESATEGLLSALGLEQSQIEELIAEYGNLDDAIDSVTEKALKEQASKILSAYDAAKEEALDAAADSMGWFSGDSITVSTRGDAKKFAEVLKNAGYLNYTDTQWSTSLFTGINDYGDYEYLLENYNKLLEMQDALEEGIGTSYTSEELAESAVYDYQKKIADQTSEIATLQKQLSAYENDTSEETKATIQKLKVELESAESDLEETQYEQYITDQKKLLDELYSEYETILNQRLDDVDALITDMIDTVNLNSDIINETITTAADNVGYSLTDSMTSIWDSNTSTLTGVITTYGTDFSSALTSVNAALSSIQAYVASMVAESEKEASTTVSSTTTTTAATKTSSSSSSSSSTSKSTSSSSSSTNFTDAVKKGVAAAMNDNVDIFTPTETDDKDIISQQKPEDENIF